MAILIIYFFIYIFHLINTSSNNTSKYFIGSIALLIFDIIYLCFTILDIYCLYYRKTFMNNLLPICVWIQCAYYTLSFILSLIYINGKKPLYGILFLFPIYGTTPIYALLVTFLIIFFPILVLGIIIEFITRVFMCKVSFPHSV